MDLPAKKDIQWIFPKEKETQWKSPQRKRNPMHHLQGSYVKWSKFIMNLV